MIEVYEHTDMNQILTLADKVFNFKIRQLKNSITLNTQTDFFNKKQQW